MRLLFVVLIHAHFVLHPADYLCRTDLAWFAWRRACYQQSNKDRGAAENNKKHSHHPDSIPTRNGQPEPPKPNDCGADGPKQKSSPPTARMALHLLLHGHASEPHINTESVQFLVERQYRRRLRFLVFIRNRGGKLVSNVQSRASKGSLGLCSLQRRAESIDELSNIGPRSHFFPKFDRDL